MAQYVYTMNQVGKIVPPKREILKDISLSFFPGAKIGVLGLVGGYMTDEADKSNRTYFLVFAVALGTVSGAAGALPVVGGPISDIMANLSTIVNAAALAVILNAVKDRVSE